MPNDLARRQFAKNASDGKSVKCQNCDEYVGEGDIDASGLCGTCQNQHEMEGVSQSAASKVQVKVAGFEASDSKTVKCQNCDEYVEEGDIDASGLCGTCQNQNEMAG